MLLHSFHALDPLTWGLLSVLLGLCVGSFLNVVAHRLPIIMENEWTDELDLANDKEPTKRAKFNLISPRSHCPKCHKKLSVKDLIPLMSFLITRGKCRFCGAAIPWRYPITELLTSLLFLCVAILYPPSLQALAWMFFCAMLLALAVIDLETYLLPDDLTLSLLWAGLLFHFYFGQLPLESAVLGAAFGYLLLWVVFHAFKLLTKKEGMGYGDFKLLAAIGAWLGVESISSVLFVAAIIGLVFGLTHQLLRKQSVHSPFPFGPSIVISAFIHLSGFNLMTLIYSV